jgi:uncharacterized cupin superfamily protein
MFPGWDTKLRSGNPDVMFGSGVLKKGVCMAKKAVKRTVKGARLSAMSIEEDQIVTGQPVAKGVVAVELARGKYTAGIWECSPGTFDWAYDADETCTIIEGEASVRIQGGQTVRFRAGDLVHFRKGMRTRWTIRKKILKTFVLYG